MSDVTVTIGDVVASVESERHWRLVRAAKARADPHVRADPVWVAKEMVYWCTCTDARNAYYILLQLPLVGDVVAVSPSRGDRVVRLLYEWHAIEPHLHLQAKQLTEQVLQALCSEANILRAGIAYAAKFPQR